MKKNILIFLIGLLLILTGCAKINFNNKSNGVVQATDVMKDIKANSVDTKDMLTEENTIKTNEFAAKLLNNTLDDTGNTLVSPVSVIYALGMTANGAGSETLKEMEKTFGLSIDELNGYLNAYLKSMTSGEGFKFNIANSIWLRQTEDFHPNKEFLQKNKDYYDAKIFEAKFDQETVKEINSWVDENTSGMIKGVIDKIPDGAMMYLINALALEADWEKPYDEGQVNKGDFTKLNGEIEETEFMYGKLHSYIEGEDEKGFLKLYKGKKYAFVALLPNEDIDLKDYVANLTGKKISNLLNDVEDVEVNTSIPKFENEFSYSLNEPLKKMGIEKAFSEKESNFSKMGEDLFISNVIHKTYISVHELGTEAGAVTAVEISVTSAPMEPPKEVYLDKPFVYMIIDTENNVPIFLGTYNGN